MADRIVRIGGASAFIVDSATAAAQLLGEDRLDHLVYDDLAKGMALQLLDFPAPFPVDLLAAAPVSAATATDARMGVAA